jgi:ribonuclease VapC
MAMTVSAAEGALVIDLAVDTSAVLAVLLREPRCDGVLERLCGASQPAVAAPTRTEILLVKLGEVGQERAREFLEPQAILTVGWDQELADASAEAFQRFGKGRHASGLNFGDCEVLVHQIFADQEAFKDLDAELVLRWWRLVCWSWQHLQLKELGGLVQPAVVAGDGDGLLSIDMQ